MKGFRQGTESTPFLIWSPLSACRARGRASGRKSSGEDGGLIGQGRGESGRSPSFLPRSREGEVWGRGGLTFIPMGVRCLG